MTEKEKEVIYYELVSLFGQTAISLNQGIAIQQKASEIIFKKLNQELDLEYVEGTYNSNMDKIVEELQLRWRFLQTIYQDLMQIAGILNHSDLLPVLPEVDFCDDLWDLDRDGSYDDFSDLTSKIDDFEHELSDLCLSWMDDVGIH